jgi:uncharacterized DUF497 family protein/predicted DNA binding CopG/RHH family protein
MERYSPSSLLFCICQIYIVVVAEHADPLDACSGFEWDEGNAHKNRERHKVSPEEAEDFFFNDPLVVCSDVRHSKREKRYYALGQTSIGPYLFITFTIRGSRLQVISVREMNRKEMPMPSAKKKPVPEFRSEAEEREFWAGHDSTEFIDWQSAQRRKFPNLKPSLRTISVRLPVSMIEDLKILANKRDVPYQSLLKVFLAERLERERRRA